MRRALIAALAAGGLLAASLPMAALAGDGTTGPTNKQLIARCIKQANIQLKGTGKQIRRSQFDTIVLGSPGDDDFTGYPPIHPGRDLFCGFGGRDVRLDALGAKLGPGDVFVGGSGRDFVHRLSGGIFVGAGDNDRVQEMCCGGLFV